MQPTINSANLRAGFFIQEVFREVPTFLFLIWLFEDLLQVRRGGREEGHRGYEEGEVWCNHGNDAGDILSNIFSSNIFEQCKILHHRRCKPLVIHQRNLLERRRGPLPCLRSVLSPNKDLRHSSNAFMKMNTHSQKKCDMFHSLLSDKK